EIDRLERRGDLSRGRRAVPHRAAPRAARLPRVRRRRGAGLRLHRRAVGRGGGARGAIAAGRGGARRGAPAAYGSLGISTAIHTAATPWRFSAQCVVSLPSAMPSPAFTTRGGLPSS